MEEESHNTVPELKDFKSANRLEKQNGEAAGHPDSDIPLLAEAGSLEGK